MNVTIQIPAYQEGDAMLPTLRSIAEQDIPDHWTVTPEVWVTLSPKDKSLCTTWKAALEAEGFDVYEAPEGKLSTRNAAHDHAVAEGADVIVTWDADAPALSDHALRDLVKPFEQNPDVVAVRGVPVSPSSVVGTLENLKRTVGAAIVGHMPGQLSAFTADAWQQAGPFDTNRDETDLQSVWLEEEHAFSNRLADVGEVITAKGAKVHNDSRRTRCKISRSMDKTGRNPVFDHCGGRNGTTFNPRSPCDSEQRNRRR